MTQWTMLKLPFLFLNGGLLFHMRSYIFPNAEFLFIVLNQAMDYLKLRDPIPLGAPLLLITENDDQGLFHRQKP